MNNAQNFTFVRKLIFTFCLFTSFVIFSQDVPFQERYKNPGITGDLVIIGNTSVHKRASVAGDPDTMVNNDFDMVYVNADPSGGIFSSSGSRLSLTGCSRVVYAGLYWATNILRTDQLTTANTIKFKRPGGSYVDVTADVNHSNTVYYKDVTNLINHSSANGDYFVANVQSDVDDDESTINRNRAAGWSLVIVFENKTLPSRYISTFDGLTQVAPGNTEQFQYSGFETPPSGDVEGKLGIVGLEGDIRYSGERLYFADEHLAPSVDDNDSRFTNLFDALNPANNFFNSRVTNENGYLTDNTPYFQNTLGWDIALLDLSTFNSDPDPANWMITNGANQATVRLATAGDRIDPFLNTFSVNVVEPKIEVLTSVKDDSGNVVSLGNTVPLGATVFYNLNFQNTGTDDATATTIVNELPFNVTLDDTSFEFFEKDGVTPLAPGLITASHNAATRQVTFTIDNSLVTRSLGDPPNEPSYNIRYKVTASSDCFDYSDACTNVLLNSLETFYTGGSSGISRSNVGLNGVDACGIGLPGAMELFVDTSSCQFDTELEFCNNNLTITGDDGYNIYRWVDDNGVEIAANSKTIVVSGPGVYTCTQTKVGCTVTTRVVTVKGLQVDFTPFDNTCKDSANGGVNITVTDEAPSYTYTLSQGGTQLSTTGVITSKTHTFNNLDIGNYSVRVTNTDGCFDIFNFTVAEPTLLTASNVVTDNIMPCNGNALTGRIEVNGAGGTQFTGTADGNVYEYSMDGGAFQTSNVFETAVQGNHTMTVKDANGCTTTTIANISFDDEIVYEVTKEDVVCLNGNNARIDVNVTQNNAGNTITYSLDGTNFQASPSFTGLTVGDYELTIRKVKGVNTCETKENISIIQLVDLAFTAESSFSCELVGGKNTITATVADEYKDKVRYRLNGGSENATGIFEDVPVGTHTITVIATVNELGRTFNCSAEPVEISIGPYLPVTITDAISSPEDENRYTIVYSGGEPILTYAFHFLGEEEVDDPTSITIKDEWFQEQNQFDIRRTGYYMILVRDARGCDRFIIKYLEFKDIQIPNFFTPNRDGTNDTWYPTYIDKYPNISVQVFDRHQRMISQHFGITESWDGKYKGKLLPSGDYWYVIRLNDVEDNRVFKGHFTLYR